jgi:hypothetical protein
MAARARVVKPGQVGVDPIGTVIPIIAGDVKLDSTADVRGTLELTTEDRTWRAALNDTLTPYGNEVFIERGVVYGDRVTEWVAQGYFRIYDVEQDSAPGGELAISGRDRMSGIVDAKPLAPQQFSNGSSVAGVFDALVKEVYPGAVIVYDFDATTASFTSSHALDDDRYAFLKDIADSLGKIMYWDYAGQLRVEDAPDPGNPVFDVTHGRGGVVTKVSRGLSRDQVYNALVATGEAVGENPPVRGVALDLNPDSPTYWDGPFGKVPKLYSSSFLTTDDQCTNAALAMLRRQVGVPYSLDFTAVPNPALEPYDPVRVSFADQQAAEIHVIESLTIGLTPGDVMQSNTRQQIRGGLGE